MQIKTEQIQIEAFQKIIDTLNNSKEDNQK